MSQPEIQSVSHPVLWVMFILGLLGWAAVFWLWKRSRLDTPIENLLYLGLVLVIHLISYNSVLIALGMDGLDDSFEWGWEEWALLASLIGLVWIFAFTKFKSSLKWILVVLPVAWILSEVW